jgi:hypothetical protein
VVPIGEKLPPNVLQVFKRQGRVPDKFSPCNNPRILSSRTIGIMLLYVFPVVAFKHLLKIRTRPQCSIMWMHRNVLGSYVPTTMSCRYSSKRIKFFSLFWSFSACFVSAIFSELKSYPGVVFYFEFPDHRALKFTFEGPDPY